MARSRKARGGRYYSRRTRSGRYYTVYQSRNAKPLLGVLVVSIALIAAPFTFGLSLLPAMLFIASTI